MCAAAARGSGRVCKVLRMHRTVSSDARTGPVNRLPGTAGSAVRAATMAYGDGSRDACSPRAVSATCQALERRHESARPCRERIQFQVRVAAVSSRTRSAEPAAGAGSIGEATVAG